MGQPDATVRRLPSGEPQSHSSALPRIPALDRSVLGLRPVTGETELDVLVEEIADLRPLPPIAAQVLQIAEGDTFSAHELAQAISSDPALTARVLRVANSAYYGFPRRITTIRDAVVLLGFRQVRSTLLATSAIRSMLAYDDLDGNTFWRHSITVGLLAQLLARHEGVHQDEAFTAGVLHNVGRLALVQARPEAFRRAIELANGRGISLHDAERYVFGFTDAEVGGALARHWRFPGDLADAIAEHAVDPADFEDHSSLAALVARARSFAAAHGVTDGVERPLPPPAPTRPPISAFAATMVAMSPADLPDPAGCGSSQRLSLAVEPALDQLLAEQGGFEHVLDRAAAFVEHTAASP